MSKYRKSSPPVVNIGIPMFECPKSPTGKHVRTPIFWWECQHCGTNVSRLNLVNETVKEDDE